MTTLPRCYLVNVKQLNPITSFYKKVTFIYPQYIESPIGRENKKLTLLLDNLGNPSVVFE